MHLLEETFSKKVQSKSAKKCNYAELERKLFAWFTRLEQSQAVVTGKLIREKALVIAAMLNETEFKASHNWLVLFKKRHNIRHMYYRVKPVVLTKYMLMYARMNCRDESGLLYRDETGLLYRAIPDRTLATRGRKGTKVQTAKDRLTVLLCCNDTGDDKIDSLVIGKAACPTAFGPKKGGWEPSSVHVQYTLHGQSR